MVGNLNKIVKKKKKKQSVSIFKNIYIVDVVKNLIQSF